MTNTKRPFPINNDKVIIENEECKKLKKETIQPNTSSLWLDTIRRDVLDFDFEKLCSVSLTHVNVYGCLVCGKFFQGRGKNSIAYFHSVEEDHHVFINLSTQKASIHYFFTFL
jgi:U4/U6.U5 tri-snRNP-associated protein 2